LKPPRWGGLGGENVEQKIAVFGESDEDVSAQSLCENRHL
jgi:hypothetical protein